MSLLHRLSMRSAVMAIAAIASARVEADFTVGSTTYNESILSDDFNGATLNAQWDKHQTNSGSVTPYATGDTTDPPNQPGSAVFWTQASGTSSSRYRKSTAYINYETDGGLNYGTSPTDWAVEVKFRMLNEPFVASQFEWESLATSGYQWSILGGYTTTDNNGWTDVKGFDLRAVRDGLKWSLGWYGGDYTNPGGVFVDRPSTIDIVPEPSLQAYWLHNNETYTIGLHRKSDGNVDIYFSGSVYDAANDQLVATYTNQLLATKPLILGENPGGLLAGDFSQLGIGGKMALDSLKMGIAAAPPALLGDFNGDTKVDAGDYVTWRKNESANASLPNDNGLTTQADRFALWQANFGNAAAGSSPNSGLGPSAVPEPATISLLVLGAFAWCGAARTRCRTKISKNGFAV